MKYLVLGSNSFAGSCFVDYLLSRGLEVIGVSRSLEVNRVNRAYVANQNLKNFTFHQLDLNQHPEELFNLIRLKKPEYIIDFASQSMVAESWQYPEHWYTTNIVAKVKLHQFLRNCDFLERYVRASTPEVYGSVANRIDENQPFNPTTPYAVSQAATDFSLSAFYKQYQFPVVFTRYANFYGPYQQFYRIIPRAIIYALLGKKLELHGGGLSQREFIYGSDVAEGAYLAMHLGKIGESYHFSSGPCISIVNLIRMIADKMAVSFDDFVEIVEDRPGKDQLYLLGTKQAEKELNWQPKVSLEEGVSNTIQWAKENIDIIKNLPLNYQHKI